MMRAWPTLPSGTKHTLAAPPIAVFDGWERSAMSHPQPDSVGHHMAHNSAHPFAKSAKGRGSLG